MGLKEDLAAVLAGVVFVTPGDQKTLARRTGISQPEISLLKRKAPGMSLDKLLYFAEKLGVKVTHSIEVGDMPEAAPVAGIESIMDGDGGFKF